MQLDLLADALAIATTETLPKPSPRPRRPSTGTPEPVAPSLADRDWITEQFDEYVAAVGTLRPRVSEAKSLLERAAAIRQDEYVPLERLAEAEQLEEEARAKLRRAADQRERMSLILERVLRRFSTPPM